MKLFLNLCTGLLAILLTAGQGCSSPREQAAPIQSASSTSVPIPPSSTLTPANVNSPMGNNIDEVSYYSTGWYFVDAFKSASPWMNWNDKDTTPIDTDANGWVRSLKPGQIAYSIIFSDLAPPAGEYIVLYEGEGTLAYSGYAVKDDKASKPGRDVVKVTPVNREFFYLQITASKPGNPIRNIRVLMPDRIGGSGSAFEANYATQIFHPLFLERIKRLSTLRFTTWMIFDDEAQPKFPGWDNRPKPSDARWSVNGKGVPLEIMVNLANRLHTNPWFNIPIMADDDYVRQFASYIRDNLDTDLKAYVEYSNEVWNDMFPQTKYVNDRGMALNLAAELPAGTKDDKDWKQIVAGQRFYAQRSVEIFRICQQVFGSTQRLVRVLATHTERPDLGVTIMDWKNTAKEADVMAVGLYFGNVTGNPAEAARIRNFTAEQHLKDLQAKAIPEVIGYAKTYAANAKARGLELIVYEGGQHLVDFNDENPNSAINKLFDASNRHPLMGEAYTQLLNGWKSSGGHLFVHAYVVGSQSTHGRWGALETITQEHSPKHDALMDFISANPRWW